MGVWTAFISFLCPQSPLLEAGLRGLSLPHLAHQGFHLASLMAPSSQRPTVFPNRWPCVTLSPPSHLPPWGPDQLPGVHQLLGSGCGDTGAVGAKWAAEAGGHRPGQTPTQSLRQPRPALLAPLRRPGRCARVCLRAVCLSGVYQTGGVCFCAAGPNMTDALVTCISFPQI